MHSKREKNALRQPSYIKNTAHVRVETIAKKLAKMCEFTGMCMTLLFQPPITDQTKSKRVFMIHHGDEADLINASISGMCGGSVELKRYNLDKFTKNKRAVLGGADQRLFNLSDVPDTGPIITEYRKRQRLLSTPETLKRGDLWKNYLMRSRCALDHLCKADWDLDEVLAAENHDAKRARIEEDEMDVVDAGDDDDETACSSNDEFADYVDVEIHPTGEDIVQPEPVDIPLQFSKHSSESVSQKNLVRLQRNMQPEFDRLKDLIITTFCENFDENFNRIN